MSIYRHLFGLVRGFQARLPLAIALALSAPVSPADAQTAALINRIVDEGMNHSQVLTTASYLADVIGGRLANSPAARQAERWTQERFRSWGLKNVHAEPFEFGRGWWIESSSVRMIAPRPLQLRAIPIAWTPGTTAPLRAPIVVAPMSREQDFEAWRGKLAGKIVLVSLPTPPQDAVDPPFRRFADSDLDKISDYQQPDNSPDPLRQRIQLRLFPRKLDAFLKSQGALAWARMSIRDNGLVHGEGYTYQVGQTPQLPAIEIAAEDYRRLARLAKLGPVSLEINNVVHFDDSDRNAYNIFADIPGRDPRAGYVMAGAHLDSWVAGDGAADNGAGSAVIMEAGRILSNLGVQPKRTIRFVLWGAEEEGLLGSSSFAEHYLGTRPGNPDPDSAVVGPRARFYSYPISTLPGHNQLDGYFNIDNGSGRIRGIYAEGNLAAAPLLKQWLAPFASMGVATVSARPTGSTDHVPMSLIGVPGFQFIQDPLDYSTRVHHSNLDTFDHLRAEDLRQAAVVLAGVLLAAADSDERIPRAVVPTTPTLSDPYTYDDPSNH